MTFSPITEHFSPAWFAAVMAAAVIPLVLSFLDLPLKGHRAGCPAEDGQGNHAGQEIPPRPLIR